MHERDPRRLKEDPGTPLDLVRALDALQQGGHDAARLERVAKRLAPLLDLPPSAAGGALSSLRAAWSRLGALKLVLLGLALLTPFVWFARDRALPEPKAAANPRPHALAETAAAPAVTPALAPAEPDIAAQARAALPEKTPLVAPEPSAHAAVRTGPARPKSSAPTSDRRDTAAAAEPSAQSEPTAPSDRAITPQTADQPRARASDQDQHPSAQPRQAAPNADDAAPLAAAAPVPSEARLLFEARKALSSDAQLALHFLNEHEARYPKGELVPEREVLAIEALRSLGRSAEASARLHRFESQYPDSLHLRRLKP
jgi:hypothetical protein